MSAQEGSTAGGKPNVTARDGRDPEELAADAQAHLVKGELKEAESAILSALDQPDKRATYYAILGRVWALQNRLNEAKAAYRHALLLDSKFATVHHRLGELLLKTGSLTEAEKELRIAVHFAPKSSAFHATLAEVLLNQYFLDDAHAHLQIALRRDKKNARAHFLMARLLAMRGDHRGAEHKIRAALALKPTPANYSLLSDILQAQSRTSDAIEAIQEACKRNPKDKTYQAKLVDLKTSSDSDVTAAAPRGTAAAPSVSNRAALGSRIRTFLTKFKS